MKMTRSLALAITAALACGSAQADGPLSREAGNTSGTASFAEVPQGINILFDQTDLASGNGAPAQTFGGAFSAYDSQGADDFEFAEASGWTIQQLNFVITQSVATGVPASVNVAIHANSPGGGDTDLPGAAVCSYTGLAPGQTGSPPSALNVALPEPCIIAPGRYWVAMTANQEFGGANGQIFWSNRTAQAFSEGVWRNPGDGFASGCTAFTPMTTCNVGGGTNPDFRFQVLGVTGGLSTDMGITLTSAPDRIAPGGSVTFTAVATNNGPSNADNVVITITTAGSGTVGTPTASAGGSCVGTSPVVCTWAGATAADVSRTATVPVTSAVTVGTLSATAVVSSDTTDPVGGNDSATAASNVALTPPTFIPTASHYGLGLLAAMLGLFGFALIRRNR